MLDTEWAKAENTGEKRYYWLHMGNGGKCVKSYTRELAALVTKRTGLKTEECQCLENTSNLTIPW